MVTASDGRRETVSTPSAADAFSLPWGLILKESLVEKIHPNLDTR